jgi:hypothetical protein
MSSGTIRYLDLPREEMHGGPPNVELGQVRKIEQMKNSR